MCVVDPVGKVTEAVEEVLGDGHTPGRAVLTRGEDGRPEPDEPRFRVDLSDGVMMLFRRLILGAPTHHAPRFRCPWRDCAARLARWELGVERPSGSWSSRAESNRS